MPLAPLLNAGNVSGGGGGPTPDVDRYTFLRRRRRSYGWLLVVPLLEWLARWGRA